MARYNPFKHNPFEIALEQLDQAAKILGLDPDTYAILRTPARELHVAPPIRRFD